MRSKRIYILPTRFGFLFLFATFAILLIGSSYENNLVNLLGYFMMSLAFVSMIQTQNNLKGIEVEAVLPDPGFAGGEFSIAVVLKNSASLTRHALEAVAVKSEIAFVPEQNREAEPGSHLRLRSLYKARRRGKFQVGKITVSTTYPVGLFRGFIYREFAAEYFIYPASKGHRPLPKSGIGEVETGSVSSKSGDDFRGHRNYQIGDSSRHIDWKARARGRPILVKEFNEGAPQAVLLDWDFLDSLEAEERLSQLTAWVQEAQQARFSFGLRLPGQEPYFGTGLGHARKCLEALAVFDPEKASIKKGAWHADPASSLG
jgi:uncharacterized protein (DUF58 family)